MEVPSLFVGVVTSALPQALADALLLPSAVTAAMISVVNVTCGTGSGADRALCNVTLALTVPDVYVVQS
jgi:hypothetical protein